MFARRKVASSAPGSGADQADSPDGPARLPWQAAAADLLATVAFLAGTAVLATGGGAWWVGSLRVSVHSSWRLYLLSLIVAAVRHWYLSQPPIFAPLVRAAGRAPLTLDDHDLQGAPGTAARRSGLGGAIGLTAAYAALVAALTWPQVQRLDSVPDYGDPLFSIWRIAWISHQLPRDPLRLFDANIFHPEPLTLTYSDPVILPALMSAPFLWLGFHPLPVYNLLFLSGWVFSGVTMFLLVRTLTGRSDAAAIAGAIFAVYPYRLDHYSHLELQMTIWMPLAVWGLHRTMAWGRLRDGLLTGLAFALQTLSSLYYGVFLSVYLLVVGGGLWLGRRTPWRPIRMLAAGAALAGVMIAPVASRYIASRPTVGERKLSEVQTYSAVGTDYLKAPARSRTYHALAAGGKPERHLFPGLTPVVLASVALWPPLSVARLTYAAALAVVVDGSLGVNGAFYEWLYEHVAPFRGLRVPARLSIFVGMTLAILAGYGAARLLRRWPRGRVPLTAVLLLAVAGEALPRMDLAPVSLKPPGIYASLPDEPKRVLAEFPMPGDEAESWFDTWYMYFSTWHWHDLLNGNSGFFPPSYEALLVRARDFPSDAAVSYLKERGVEYVTVHGAFLDSDRYRGMLAMIERRVDLELVTAAPWGGSESRLYRLRR